MNEHVLAAVFTLDEAEAFLNVEELDRTLALTDDLRRHSATCAAARAAEAAAAAAAAAGPAGPRTTAEPAAIAAAEAAAITAAETATATATAITAAKSTPVTTAVERIKTFFAETVPLVATAPATSSIETHKPELTFASPPT
jgi:hypothetical protein